VHLFGFIIKIYDDARSSKCQMRTLPLFSPALEPGVTESTLLALPQHSPNFTFYTSCTLAHKTNAMLQRQIEFYWNDVIPYFVKNKHLVNILLRMM
jgi:hypothetical protein